MKTIYDKLKPELRAKILRNAKQYNNATNNLIEVLKKKEYYAELTVREVQSLATFTDVWIYESDPIGLIFGTTFVGE